MKQAQQDRGSATLEAVGGAAAFAAFAGLVFFGGQLALAHQTVQTAAAEAARTASIARTQGQAQAEAVAAANRTLNNRHLTCVAKSVTVDTGDFNRPLGQPGFVSATVICGVSSRDLGIPIALGTIPVEQTMRSPLDSYRPRS